MDQKDSKQNRFFLTSEEISERFLNLFASILLEASAIADLRPREEDLIDLFRKIGLLLGLEKSRDKNIRHLLDS